MKTLDDPIVAEVRRHRDKLAAKFGYDVRRIAADLQARQKHNPRLVTRKRKRAAK